MSHVIKRHLAATLVVLAVAAPAAAQPLEHLGSAASHAWQSVTGFGPAHVNGLILFSGRFGPYGGGPLQAAAIGEVDRNHRWRCAATVGGTRLYSTGFTETAARDKLEPYAQGYFRCRPTDHVSVFDSD